MKKSLQFLTSSKIYKEKTQIIIVRNEGEAITTHSTDVKIFLRYTKSNITKNLTTTMKWTNALKTTNYQNSSKIK